MNAPYPPILIQADGKFYPFHNETLARIVVIENTRNYLPLDAVYRLEPDPDFYGYRYSEIDAVEFVRPAEVETPTQELTLVA